jgi:hypothetical protein
MSSYQQYATFGKAPIGSSDPNQPLTMCLQDTMDVKFHNGGIGNLYGPRSQRCQLYMSERCAKKWDGFCEYFYRSHQSPSQWPDNQQWPNTVSPWSYGVALSTGDQLLQNAAERKYCKYVNCAPKSELFNPTNPAGPSITYYESSTNDPCIPVCRVNPSSVDEDPVMERLLENPRAGGPVLINICNTAKREGTNLKGTKLGRMCSKLGLS